MKSYGIQFLLLGMMVLGGLPIFSQNLTDSDDLLVSTQWLNEHLTDPGLVILYHGNPSVFEKGHIPGSRLISLGEILVENENGLSHELPDGPKIQQLIRSWGINNDSRIVICYEDEKTIPMATRLYITLDYSGMGDQVSILNGGLTAWKKENKILEKDQTAYQEGHFEIHLKTEILIFKDEIQASLDSQDITIVDARPIGQFSGKTKDHNSERKGHIPGAVNIPFSSLSPGEAPYLFKSEKELLDLFEEHGVLRGSRVLVYCGSGIWASPVYFALRLLGYHVRFYDGSFQEWGNELSLPVALSDEI